jgi:hypothetical protein
MAGAKSWRKFVSADTLNRNGFKYNINFRAATKKKMGTGQVPIFFLNQLAPQVRLELTTLRLTEE